MPELNRKNILILVLGAAVAFAAFTFFSATPAEADEHNVPSREDICADRALDRASGAVVALNLRQAKNQLSRAVRCFGVRVRRGSEDDATLASGVVCAFNSLDNDGGYYGEYGRHERDTIESCFEDAIEDVLDNNEDEG